ncbi:uncharacterized protein N7469_011425 [Penicillium citrinum]|uniref:non-specific serine/threonine protein kinase n=1 Tax=Penicillium citrinum TaxID=5077 RepID=A0A9W9NDC8_PENCI|nr:uncharacterized protein N7469_011425 [Penicillium citrinum]KAJ5217800.1 hypothetical protein N7469_011425 [Penicillium citrinum]
MEGKMISRLPDLVLDTRITVECHPEAHYHFTAGTGSKPGRYARPCEVKRVWKKEKLLGSGSFGDVYLHRCATVGGAAGLQAIKEIDKTRISSNKIDYYKEIEAIARFSQQKFRGLFVEFLGWYENDKSVFLAMEYIEHGDLGSYLTKPLPEEENIFVIQPGPEWLVKLGDFGISKRVNENTSVSTYVGTRLFMAPEIQGHVPPGEEDNSVAYNFTASIDMWSVGVTTFFMLFHDYPFKLEELNKLVQYVRGGDFPFPNSSLVFSPDCYRFIEAVMARHPRKRLSASEALNTDWLSQLYLSSPQTEVVEPVDYFPELKSAPSDAQAIAPDSTNTLRATVSVDLNLASSDKHRTEETAFAKSLRPAKSRDVPQDDSPKEPRTITSKTEPQSSPPLPPLLSHVERQLREFLVSEDRTMKAILSTSPEKQDSKSKSRPASAEQPDVSKSVEDQVWAQIQNMHQNDSQYHPDAPGHGASWWKMKLSQERLSSNKSSSDNVLEQEYTVNPKSSSRSIAEKDQKEDIIPYDPKFDELRDEGVRLYQMQRYGEAEELLNRVFPVQKLLLGMNNPSTLLTCSLLGSIAFQKGNYDTASLLLEFAAEKRAEILGRTHPDTLISYNGLGSCHFALKKYREAEAIFKQIMDDVTTQFGPSNRITLAFFHMFGRTLFMRGKYIEAEAIFCRLSEGEKGNTSLRDGELMESLLWSSLNAFELGETADAGFTLGMALYNLKRYQEAKDTFDTVIKERLGDTHRAHFLLGKCLEPLKQDYQATRAYRIAVAWHTRILGTAHKDTLESVYRLSRMYYKTKTYTSAETSFQQFLKHAVDVWGAEDTKVLDAICTCGMAQYRLQKYELAEINLACALQGWTKIYGTTHETTMNALYWNCLVQHRLGMYDVAEATCREAITRESEIHGYAGSSTLNNLMEIIKSLHHNGKRDRAKDLIDLLIKTKKNPKTWTDEFNRDAKEVIRLVTVESASASDSPGTAGSGTTLRIRTEGQRRNYKDVLRIAGRK